MTEPIPKYTTGNSGEEQPIYTRHEWPHLPAPPPVVNRFDGLRAAVEALRDRLGVGDGLAIGLVPALSAILEQFPPSLIPAGVLGGEVEHHAILSGLLADKAALQAELTAATQRIAELEPPPSPYHQPGVKWVSADLYGARREHVDALQADKAALQEEVQRLQADKERLLGALETALQAQDTLRAAQATRAIPASAADRFRRTCQAWQRFLPYDQQLAIVTGLIAQEVP